MSNPPPIPTSPPPSLPRSVQAKPKERFTLAGTVLLLVTIAAAVFSAVFCLFWLFPRIMPEGGYPRILLAIPIIGSGVIVFGAGSWVLNKLGIQVSVPIAEKPSGGDRTASHAQEKIETI
jgi:hypothetical protein